MDPLSWWTKEHGDIAPVGHALRTRYADRWIRFHSLPQLKRYPDSEQEMQEVLHRATTVANALFKEGEVIYVYISRFCFEDSVVPAFKPIAGNTTERGSVNLRANPGDIPPEDDDVFTTWVRQDSWPPQFFEELIRQVAREEESLVCLVSPGSGNIFCPYDGGMDIFSLSRVVGESLGFLGSWRSPRSDGM